jgi:uncharacterized membrane protein HdeD (DUF308 family)
MSTPIEAIPHRPSRSSLFLAIILIIFGMFAISFPAFTSIGVVKVLGWLLIFDGFAQFVHAFLSEGIGRTAWKLLVSFVYIGGGAILLANSHLGVGGLTYMLAILFFAEGVVDLTAYFATRKNDRSAWILSHGIISMILSLIIWQQWPSGSFRVIGAMVGIGMIISGVCRLFMALEARKHGRSYRIPGIPEIN